MKNRIKSKMVYVIVFMLIFSFHATSLAATYDTESMEALEHMSRMDPNSQKNMNDQQSALLNLHDTADMDIETMLMLVQTQRANLLDTQLRDQLEEVNRRNQMLSESNIAIENLRRIEMQIHDSIQQGKPVFFDNLKEKLKYLDESVLKYFENLDGTIPTPQDINYISTLVDDQKIIINSLSNSQQMDMLRLQELSNKRNEAFEVMTNYVKKMRGNRSSIISNMR